MVLRGLPFGTMVTPHSVEVWQVVEEKKQVQLVGTQTWWIYHRYIYFHSRRKANKAWGKKIEMCEI